MAEHVPPFSSLATAPVVSAIVPAAGLGTRLSPLSLGCPKELLPIGLYPALTACLLEAAAAGLSDLVVVSSPHKPGLRALSLALAAALDAPTSSLSAPSPQTLALARLWQRLRVRIVDQPQPLGVLDAVERGLEALGAAAPSFAVAVLFPDLLHLPDQTALTHLVAAHQKTGAAVFGLRRARRDDRPGSTLSVRLGPPWADAAKEQIPLSTPLPIVALAPAQGRPDELLTTFGQVQTPAWNAALHRHCRSDDRAALCDAGFLAALNDLAQRGGLYGTLLAGDIVDLGTLAGYGEVVRRFSVASAHLRGVP
ncbi:MAG: NTP transferase domain-containing protein [Myxococcales bacterium]|nr:NTP transferase domain-containing protein [Myxococcales bacterium]